MMRMLRAIISRYFLSMAGVSSCVSSCVPSCVSSSVLEGGGGAALTTGQAETGSIQAGTERLERLRVT